MNSHIRAVDIMTEEITTFTQEDRANGVRQTMRDESFDVAPIEISGQIRSFVRKKDIEDVGPTRKVIKDSIEIEEKHLIGRDIPVMSLEVDSQDLLTILDKREMEFVFVVGEGIEGIITIADFNHVRSGIPLYALISEYEMELRTLIDDELPNDRWLSTLDEENKKWVRDRYGEEEEENAELRLVDCLTTEQTHEIILEHELWQVLRFSNEQDAKDTLEEFKDLRDAVMHHRPLVGKHTFSEFVSTVSQMKEITQEMN